MNRLNRLLRSSTQKSKRSEKPLGTKRNMRTSSEDRSVPDGHIEARVTQFGPVLRVRLQNQWFVLDLVKEEESIKNHKLANNISGEAPTH